MWFIKTFRSHFRLFSIASLLVLGACSPALPEISVTKNLRAPAYPLITIDPYTSAWSMSDRLYDDVVRHWTGTRHGMVGALRVDGKLYRFLGKEELPRKALLPMANLGGWDAKYLLSEPSKGWELPAYKAEGWIEGKGSFGTADQSVVVTPWDTQDIWVRREFTLDSVSREKPLYLVYSHDDIFELYLNGEKLVATGYEWKQNVVLSLDSLRHLLPPGQKSVIAVHCHNRTGGGYVDFGIFAESDLPVQFPETATQRSVSLSATGTHYRFTCGPVDLKLTFTSPLLPSNLDLLSRPVGYIDYEVVSNDGMPHTAEIYLDVTPEWAVDDLSQTVKLESGHAGSQLYLRSGTTEQPILQKSGDNRRIDWGYLYLSSPSLPSITYNMGGYASVKQQFVIDGKLNSHCDTSFVASMAETIPVMACSESLGRVDDSPKSGYMLLGYDDLFAVEFFGDQRMAWWKKEGEVQMDDMLVRAALDCRKVRREAILFDNQLWNSCLAVGGEKYAEMCVLAYRQAVAAHKLVRNSEGEPLFFSKENFSNGSIGTVDVTYPSAPLFLYYNPELLKGMLNPIFYYSESGKWTKPFPAHDVGTYPKANGQTYGEDMPVEEAGNMLILTAAIARAEKSASYAAAHWEVLSVWADYLLEKGLDPDNQLCTDDFAGHLAHNANLSVKAILGVASYGRLAGMLHKDPIAATYTAAAHKMAEQWIQMASDNGHYRLTFDGPGTWSQKYNLVWDQLLDFNLFPREVIEKELAWYLTKQNRYGLPLDSRRAYTKSDWIIWTASMAPDQERFRALTDPIHLFYNETTDRVPMTDWYETKEPVKVGFQARSVVGGFFMKLLKEKWQQ